MADLSIDIQDMLEAGYLPVTIARQLEIPVTWVHEEVEQEEYTFADYLEAVRAQYGDEDAVLIANEAFKNQDITLFNYQSQSPEA
jgi:ferredoxin-NADP reductase